MSLTLQHPSARTVDQLAATDDEREARGEFLFEGAGEILKKHRIDRSITLEEVAQKLGINRSTVFRYEDNKTPLSDYAVTRFAVALGMDPQVLMLECLKKVMPGMAETTFGQLLQKVVENNPQ
ncbi:MAG: helix-turn-helix domain-containing protein [Fimbriiglobus sp.]